MQDSIQLPSDPDTQQINFFVSPNNSVKKQPAYHFNTGSQQSLAYSSETHAKYENSHRSPSHIQIPNFQTSEKPASLKRMIRAANISFEKSPSLHEVKSQQQILVTTNQEQRSRVRQQTRKTLNKNQYNVLSKKYKQIQYALHLEVISSEELRTKVAILTQLLEEKMRTSELSYFLNLRNTSKNMKNVDIFMELKQNQKKLKQSQLIIDQQRQEIQRLVDHCTLRSSRKQNMNNGNTDPQAQIEALIQEKESLFNYIEELRKQYNDKSAQHEQIVQELQRCQEKQHRFITIQRAKLIQQISERTNQIGQLRRQVEEMKMEKNLIQLKYDNQIQEIKNSWKEQAIETLECGTMTTQKMTRCVGVQAEFADAQMPMLKTQVRLLKSQRDYYIQQYKKRLQESSQNYLLKVQLKSYQKKQ